MPLRGVETNPKVKRHAKWAVIQYSTLMFACGVTMLTSLNALAIFYDCVLLTNEGSGNYLPSPRQYTVDLEPTFQNAPGIFKAEHNEVECSCDLGIELGETDNGTAKYLASPELTVNMSKLTTCGGRPTCFELVDFADFPLKFLDDSAAQKVIGFSPYRSNFLKLGPEETVLDSQERLETALASKKYDINSRVPFIVRKEPGDGFKTRWLIAPFNAAVQQLQSFEKSKVDEYRQDLADAMEDYDSATSLCNWGYMWVYVAIGLLVFAGVQLIGVAYVGYLFFISQETGVFSKGTHSALLFVDSFNNIIGIWFFAGVVANIDSVVGSLNIAVLTVSVILNVVVWFTKPKDVDIHFDEHLDVTIKTVIRVTVKRYAAAGFVLGTTLLSALVSIGLFVVCKQRLYDGPVAERVADYAKDLEAFVLEHPSNYVTIHHDSECSCSSEYNTTLTQGTNGTWYLFNETLVVNTTDPGLFCDITRGCFNVGPNTFARPPDFINWVINGSSLLETFNLFDAAVITPIDEAGVNGALSLIKTLQQDETAKPWIVRRQPSGSVNPKIFTYMILNRAVILNALYDHQSTLKKQFDTRNSLHLQTFEKETTTCDPERPFRSLAITTMALSGIQILWICLVFFVVLRWKESWGLIHFQTRHYLLLMIFDTVVDIVFLILFSISLQWEVRVEVVLNIVVLICNFFGDGITLRYTYLDHKSLVHATSSDGKGPAAEVQIDREEPRTERRTPDSLADLGGSTMEIEDEEEGISSTSIKMVVET